MYAVVVSSLMSPLLGHWAAISNSVRFVSRRIMESIDLPMFFMKANKKLFSFSCEIETRLRRSLSLQALREILRSRVDDFIKINKKITYAIEAIHSKLMFASSACDTPIACRAFW